MLNQWQIPNADQATVERIGALIALKLQPGDVITLTGDLGAGKTTLARALIRASMSDLTLDVPSPTYALMQSYPDGRVPITHLDLYRLQDDDELLELGLEDALVTGALVVEWPERLPLNLLENSLAVTLRDSKDTTDARDLELASGNNWQKRLQRIRDIATFFVERPNWQSTKLTSLQGDASARSYARVANGVQPALLMDAPAQPDGPVVRDGKSYSQLAHLAEDVRPFVAVAGALNELGIAAPQIFAADFENGLLLVEDLGGQVYGNAVTAGVDQDLLWKAATDVLLHIRSDIADQTWTFVDDSHYRLPVFSSTVMQTEADLFVDWYWPHVMASPIPEPLRQDYHAICKPIFSQAAKSNRHWVLRDYHSPNLIWRPDNDGLARLGVIDFQDALRGPAEYDLASLLQDARLDVPKELETRLFDYYCAEAAENSDGSDDFDQAATEFRFRVLGAQRALKILGIFARLAKRDHKQAYLAHIPRIWGYLERNLAHPELRELKTWLDEHIPNDLRIARSVA